MNPHIGDIPQSNGRFYRRRPVEAGPMLAERVDETLEFALYRLRDDGDYDLVALFPASGCMTMCADGDDETLQFHAAHELLSNLEMDDQSDDYLLVAGDNLRTHAPSVLEKEAHEQRQS